jgi:hypothetical protein
MPSPPEEEPKQVSKKHRVETPSTSKEPVVPKELPKELQSKEPPKEKENDLRVKIPKDKLLLARKNTKENISSNGTPLAITELSPPAAVSVQLPIIASGPHPPKFSKVRIRIQNESLMVKDFNKT